MSLLRSLASLAAAAAAASCALASSPAPAPGFHFSNVFGSHMVLQRDRPIPVWGWAAQPGDTITVTVDGVPYQDTADGQRMWKVTLPSRPVSFTPFTISATASSTNQTIVLDDLLSGDVYLCSGQSK
jgi:sialate O-acetylesterase